MKNSFAFSALIACTLASLGLQTHADQPWPRPAFMPSTPPAEKAIADYTPAELVGAIATREVPASHPFDSVTDLASLKSNWPGATDKTKIDAMVQIVLDAPATADTQDFDIALQNMRYVIQEVMSVSDTDKADAFVRIVAAQTDSLKIKRAKKFAGLMFEELLDDRLLAFAKEALDDATEYAHPIIVAPEGKPRKMTSTRVEAKRDILRALKHTLEMGIDETPFKTSDEAANCAALKTWLTTNWTLITNKCAQVKAAPDRVKPKVNIQAWDARW